MSETTPTIRRYMTWMAAAAVAAGLGVGALTGAGVALADDDSGGHDRPSSEESGDNPSTRPPGITISQRTLENLSRTDELHSLKLQTAMDRKAKLYTTLSNVLKKADDTAQNVADNIK